MKRIADNTDYSEYEETNQMQETIRMLQRIYGY